MRVALVAAALLISALPAAEAGANAPGKTQVSITVWPQGRGVAKPFWSLTLACRPPRGAHPAPAQACRRLLSNADALRPVPSGALCGAVSGGPQQAFVHGTVNGAKVRAALNRRNLCEIRRWDRLGPVLPRGVPTTRLQITVWPSGDAKPSFQTSLWCNPAGGTHPRRRRRVRTPARDRRSVRAGPGREAVPTGVERPAGGRRARQLPRAASRDAVRPLGQLRDSALGPGRRPLRPAVVSACRRSSR